ncbi:MAG: stage II sporulation protein M [Candidatus Pacearchaeota archaeon]|nr:stage II sporulation protein M [Candidatus Pacearchaeota archaeon]
MKKVKKSFDIIKEYKKSWEYLKESKNFIFIIIGIFVFFVLVGFVIPPPEFIYNEIMKFVEELFETTKDMSMSQLIGFIISNNTKSTFFGILLGMFFGIFPIISAISNGYLLGFVSALSVQNAGFSVLWKLLPHGIFELPAVFISLGLGLKLGTFIFKKEKMKHLKEYTINSFKVFFLVIVPLLIIAGIIEGTLMVLSK